MRTIEGLVWSGQDIEQMMREASSTILALHAGSEPQTISDWQNIWRTSGMQVATLPEVYAAIEKGTCLPHHGLTIATATMIEYDLEKHMITFEGRHGLIDYPDFDREQLDLTQFVQGCPDRARDLFHTDDSVEQVIKNLRTYFDSSLEFLVADVKPGKKSTQKIRYAMLIPDHGLNLCFLGDPHKAYTYGVRM